MFTILGLDPTVSVLLVLVFLFVFAVGAGLLGGMLGLGGGVFIVPMLILLFGLSPPVAIATSLVAVIATSSGAASTYASEGLADLRIAMFLEVATVIGGVLGAIVTVAVLAHAPDLLVLAFVPVVLVPAGLMFRQRRSDTVRDPPRDAWADRLRLHGEYYDEGGHRIDYRVTGTRAGLALSGIAGVLSGLFGIGGGIVYVPAMNGFMNVPIRVAGATSNFMIGMTASASAIIYLFAGEVALFWCAPIVVGMMVGSRLGIGYQRSASVSQLKVTFAVVLVVAAILMALRGVGVLA
ncbi:MAG TPA: sulfite exporter TauE/SafE family protein [Thermoplasmata archaeon]|nr:sulfite exporter TauE/SafE family protein [Thermoplasmata archaeon]